MNGVRLIVGLPIAALVTAALFLLMQQLITRDVAEPGPVTPVVKVVITPQFTEPEPRPEPLTPVVPDDPPPPDFPVEAVDPSEIDPVDVPLTTPEPTTEGLGQVAALECAPVIRIPPQYPSRCTERAEPVETVVMTFSIGPDGSVVSPEIATSTNSCFNSAAVRSLSQWKYNPPGEGGEAACRLQAQLTFQLEPE